ncbi:MAG: hypothetical protein NWE89_15355 [Candidatus Bathyarchaeota archaeon]|nr:hypothetical protein [Candidatus Bathyarchaeota archaeon]
MPQIDEIFLTWMTQKHWVSAFITLKEIDGRTQHNHNIYTKHSMVAQVEADNGPRSERPELRRTEKTGFKGVNGLWLDENLRLKVRTLGHFAF